uniref:Uncharacterized protein n=1 Tax=Heliothis virescens TaxID=7102 RepID=A0A2A4JXF6_HELVI
MRNILVQSAVLLDILYCVTSQDLHFRPVIMMQDLYRPKITRSKTITPARPQMRDERFPFNYNGLDDIALIIGHTKTLPTVYSSVTPLMYRPVQADTRDSPNMAWLEALDNPNPLTEVVPSMTSSTMVPMRSSKGGPDDVNGQDEALLNCVKWANCQKKVWRDFNCEQRTTCLIKGQYFESGKLKENQIVCEVAEQQRSLPQSNPALGHSRYPRVNHKQYKLRLSATNKRRPVKTSPMPFQRLTTIKITNPSTKQTAVNLRYGRKKLTTKYERYISEITQGKEIFTTPYEVEKGTPVDKRVSSSTRPPYPDGIRPTTEEISGDYELCGGRANCHKHFVISEVPQFHPWIQISDLYKAMIFKNSKFQSHVVKRKPFAQVSTQSKPICGFDASSEFNCEQQTTYSSKKTSYFEPEKENKIAYGVTEPQSSVTYHTVHPSTQTTPFLRYPRFNQEQEQPLIIPKNKKGPVKKMPESIRSLRSLPTPVLLNESEYTNTTKTTEKIRIVKVVVVRVSSSTRPPYPRGIIPETESVSGDYVMCGGIAVCHKHVWTTRSTRRPRPKRRHYVSTQSKPICGFDASSEFNCEQQTTYSSKKTSYFEPEKENKIAYGVTEPQSSVTYHTVHPSTQTTPFLRYPRFNQEQEQPLIIPKNKKGPVKKMPESIRSLRSLPTPVLLNESEYTNTTKTTEKIRIVKVVVVRVSSSTRPPYPRGIIPETESVSAKEQYYTSGKTYQSEVFSSDVELQRSFPIISTIQPKVILRQANIMQQLYEEVTARNNKKPTKTIPDIRNNVLQDNLPTTQETITEPKDEPITEPTDEPITEPTDEPITEPTDDTITEPKVETITEKTTTVKIEEKQTKRVVMITFTTSTRPPYPDGVKPETEEISGDYPMCDERAICHKYVWSSKQPLASKKTHRRRFKMVKSFEV